MTTTFTPENSALVLIDHQVGTMQLIKNIDVALARRMSLALAKTARILGIPTVLTSSQEDRVQGPLLHEFRDILPEAFEKRIKREGIVNAWTDANFKAAIEATGAEESDHGRRDDRRLPRLPGDRRGDRRLQRAGRDGRLGIAV